MRLASIVIVAIVALAGAPAHAADTADSIALSRMLALVQGVMDVAVAAPPGTEQQAVDGAMRDILGGRNAQANALARDILPALSPEDRERLSSIARSAAVLSERGGPGAAGGPDGLRSHATPFERRASERVAIEARKDLTAMGLTYHDPRQFLDAARRGDAIALQLFLSGQGVPPDAKDADGASALELARRSGNPEAIALLSGSAK